MTIEEDKDFLTAQKENRRGCMLSVDGTRRHLHSKKLKEDEKIQERIRKCQQGKRKLEEVV